MRQYVSGSKSSLNCVVTPANEYASDKSKSSLNCAATPADEYASDKSTVSFLVEAAAAIMSAHRRAKWGDCWPPSVHAVSECLAVRSVA